MTYSARTKSIKRAPQRSCASCRAKAEKSDLIRIVRSPEGLAVVDTMKKLPGRGTYICPDDDCIERARKSGSLSRALGITVQEDFWQKLRDEAMKSGVNIDLKVRSILGLSRKSGTLLIGTDNIEGAKRKVLVMTASDCSESVRKFSENHECLSLAMNIEELSETIGSRGGVQIVGLPLSSGFAKKILSLYNVKGENAI